MENTGITIITSTPDYFRISCTVQLHLLISLIIRSHSIGGVFGFQMSVDYAARLSKYDNKGVCGTTEVCNSLIRMYYQFQNFSSEQ